MGNLSPVGLIVQVSMEMVTAMVMAFDLALCQKCVFCTSPLLPWKI
jgi:hypothetical protein